MSLPLPWPDVRKQTPNGQALEPDAVQQNLEKIALEWPVGNFAGRRIAYGEGSSTWTASTKAADVTITHGLGTTPVFAGVVYQGSLGAGFYGMTTADETDLVVTGWCSASVSTSVDFYWVVIG